MQCPRCGFDQPASEECIACGVVISKYLSTVDELAGIGAEADLDDDPFAALAGPDGLGEGIAADPFQLAPTTGSGRYAEAPQSYAGAEQDPFPSRPLHDAEGGPIPTGAARPVSRVGATPSDRVSPLDFGGSTPLYIGGAASVIRIVAAFVCLGLGVVMVLNGEGLRSAWPYAVMVFYGAGALWGLLTARQSITVRQFGIEMAVLVLVTVALRLASPETFAIESSETSAKPAAATRLPDSPIGRFTRSCIDFLEATDDVLKLSAPVERERWATLSKALDFSALKLAYDGLDTEERARVFDVWKRLADFGPIVASMLERYMIEDANGNVRVEIPEVERRAVGGELPETMSRLRRLQERISEVDEAPTKP